MDRDVADALALAEDSEHAFAGGAGDVVDVGRDDLAHPKFTSEKTNSLKSFALAVLEG